MSLAMQKRNNVSILGELFFVVIHLKPYYILAQVIASFLLQMNSFFGILDSAAARSEPSPLHQKFTIQNHIRRNVRYIW